MAIRERRGKKIVRNDRQGSPHPPLLPLSMTYVTHLPLSGGFGVGLFCIGLEGIVACEDGLERMSVTTDAAPHDYVLSRILILWGRVGDGSEEKGEWKRRGC